MEGCNYAGAMEVHLGADAITTRGLVSLVWWIMLLRGKVPRDSWCEFVRIKWGSPAAVVCRSLRGMGPEAKSISLRACFPARDNTRPFS